MLCVIYFVPSCPKIVLPGKGSPWERDNVTKFGITIELARSLIVGVYFSWQRPN